MTKMDDIQTSQAEHQAKMEDKASRLEEEFYKLKKRLDDYEQKDKEEE